MEDGPEQSKDDLFTFLLQQLNPTYYIEVTTLQAFNEGTDFCFNMEKKRANKENAEVVIG